MIKKTIYKNIINNNVCNCIGIVSQGFNRVLIPNGEIKKEFDSMLMNFEQQQQQIELQNLELAKQLQVNYK